MLESPLLSEHRFPSVSRSLNQQVLDRRHSSVQSSRDVTSVMEKLKKPVESFVVGDSRKDRSLTSIIDQLLINRSKNAPDSDHSENQSEKSPLSNSNGDCHSGGQRNDDSDKWSPCSPSTTGSIGSTDKQQQQQHSDVGQAHSSSSKISSSGGSPSDSPPPPSPAHGDEGEDEGEERRADEEEVVAEEEKERGKVVRETGSFGTETDRKAADQRPTGGRRLRQKKRQRRQVKEALKKQSSTGASCVSPVAKDGPSNAEEEEDEAAAAEILRAEIGGQSPLFALSSSIEAARALSAQISSRPGHSGKKSSEQSSPVVPARAAGSTPPPHRRHKSRAPSPPESPARAVVMPTDTLVAAPSAALARDPPAPHAVVKSERFSPEIDSSLSPSLSPHSPSPARGFPSPGPAALALGAFGLGLRTNATSSSSSVPAFPHQSAGGGILDRFSPVVGLGGSSAHHPQLNHSSTGVGGGVPATAGSTPAIKQMEMMTRNYSDFMRSLAAKYNNQNSQDTNTSLSLGTTNGLNRSLDTGYPYKTSSPRQLTGRSSGDDLPSSGVRGTKRENQTSPPLLTPQHHPATSALEHHAAGLPPHHRFAPYNLSDFSSSQTLLNLVRTASAQSASQLENYLRGAAGKRSLDVGETRGDPLDLSSKRCRTDYLNADPLTAAALHGVSERLHPVAAAAGIPFRDLRDLVHHGGLKLDPSEFLSGPIADLNAALRLSAKRGASLNNLLDNRLHNNNNNNNASKVTDSSPSRTLSSALSPNSHKTNATSAGKTNCVSLCTEQSCSSKSDASEVSRWTVLDVVQFIATLDSCSEYAEKFQEQSIDGASLCMLSEEHLTSFLGMKLGPALRLKAAIAKKIGHCATCMHCIHCHRDNEAVHRTSSSPHPSPRPQSSSPGGHSSSGHHSNKETSRSSPVSK